jgi:oligosaccharyltransferase complex subunit alpha (ribophorin I)
MSAAVQAARDPAWPVKLTEKCFPTLQVAPTILAELPVGAACHSVKLASPLPKDGVASLTVTAVLAKAQKPLPEEITQNENQLMLFRDNVYILSPYAVSAQTTEVSALQLAWLG